MDDTRAQEKALDDELVAPPGRLKIGKSNLRLSSILKSKEPTLQVALDALKLTPFYNAFEISADIFKEPPLEEEILSFIRDFGHTGEIKFLSDVNVNHMHQPWKSFAAIINKCLSGKTNALESLRLSRTQILWGMYHNKTVDYVYLLWEDLVYQGIPRRNKMFWHYPRNDFMFTTSEAYMTYRAYATGEKTPKPKTTKKKADSESSPKTKSTQASKGKRITTLAKGDKPAKKKQSVTKSKGLTVLSESKVPDEQQQNIFGINEGAGDKPKVLDVPEYGSESEEESWT
ncbi:hypothetical protein Tco_1072522 [Tanacetum coccineum]